MTTYLNNGLLWSLASMTGNRKNQEETIITNERKKDIVIFNQRMAGYLMLKGYVLLEMRPDIKSISHKNIFIFRDTPQLRQSMSDYLMQ